MLLIIAPFYIAWWEYSLLDGRINIHHIVACLVKSSKQLTGNMVLGKLALVTGGGGGIGQATCQILAREGATVVAADLSLKAAEDTIKTLTGKDHSSMFLDVTKEKTVDEVFQIIIKKYGTPPNIIINCAGILIFKPFLEETADLYERQFEINVKGTFLVTQKACKELISAGLPGSIVNMSSVCADGSPMMIAYSTTKAAIECFSKAVGREMAEFGIRCNAVAPGPVNTPLVHPIPPEYSRMYTNRASLRRFAEPMEIAELIVFVASEKGSYIANAVLNINGGY